MWWIFPLFFFVRFRFNQCNKKYNYLIPPPPRTLKIIISQQYCYIRVNFGKIRAVIGVREVEKQLVLFPPCGGKRSQLYGTVRYQQHV